MRRQEELRRLEELRNQELQKRKQIQLRYFVFYCAKVWHAAAVGLHEFRSSSLESLLLLSNKNVSPAKKLPLESIVHDDSFNDLEK